MLGVRIPPRAPVLCQPSHLGKASVLQADLGGFNPHGWYQYACFVIWGWRQLDTLLEVGSIPTAGTIFWVSRGLNLMDLGPDGTAVPLHGAIDGVRFTAGLPVFGYLSTKVDLCLKQISEYCFVLMLDRLYLNLLE